MLVATAAFVLPSLRAQPPPVDLSQANLEDLMDIKVTSVSKREQKLSQTAASISVINQEDIRRSGATNIPDLLRMAPGVNVAQINANTWAISVRGFNTGLSNKVLVLIDGRTVYSPIFSGAHWDAVDMPLENIERIEIIRGPGASVWGANAVNGVISIITKHSKDTVGGLAAAGGGTGGKHSETLQYGGAAGEEGGPQRAYQGTYRAFVKGSGFGNSGAVGGGAADDKWQRIRSGFRSDWTISPNDSLMVEGGFHAIGERQTRNINQLYLSGQTVHQAADEYGGDLRAQWNHTSKGGAETSLTAYFNSSRRTDFGVRDKVDTVDVDFQQHAAVGDRQDVVWGAGYRSDHMRLDTGDGLTVLPTSKAVNLFSAFVQDEVRLSDSVWLTLGSKVEHNSYTGLEIEPSARLVWSPSGGRHTVWASGSRALRQPALLGAAIQVNIYTSPVVSNQVTVFRLFGNPQIKDEELRDYEVGYRVVLTKKVSIDASSFLSFYYRLETVGAKAESALFIPGVPSQLIVPFPYENKAHSQDWGGEISINWNASTRWRMSTGYSYLRAKLHVDSDSFTLPGAVINTSFPQNMVEARSFLNLGHKVEFDQMLYYTARLPGGAIPGHARLDFRLARKLGGSMEISVTGQNLLHKRTTEYGDSNGVVGTQSMRSIFSSVSWHIGQKAGS